MKKWLKFFGLSFFSDKISKQAIKRGYTNVALGFIVALVFLFCGVLAADVIPFGTHYNNSDGFKNFVYNAFAQDGGDRIELTVKDSAVSFSGGVVDTFYSESDAEEYALNGYNLVVDTRPADALDDFEAYYLSNDGKEQKISAEEYATLSDVAKRNFDFKINYTPNELILTDGLTAAHEEYLTKTNNAVFAELYKKQGEMKREEYRKQVYTLYIKAYYPDLSAYESTGSAPLLRNYYYHNYVNKGAQKYLLIFNDSCVGSFETDGGSAVTFYGFYNKLPDGAIGATRTDADNFIKTAFSATTSLSVYVYIMNIFRMLPFIALMPLLLALITYCVLRLVKAQCCKGYGGCLKIIGSYLMFGSLFAAVVTFILGYFVPRESLLITVLLSFFVILLIRTAIFLIAEFIAAKKAPQDGEKETNTSTEVET